MLSLREVASGEPGGGITWVYTSISMSDLTLCKEKLSWFSEDPREFIEEFNHLALTQDLTCSDLQIVLSHCCTVDEKQRIIEATGAYADELAGCHAQRRIRGLCRRHPAM